MNPIYADNSVLEYFLDPILDATTKASNKQEESVVAPSNVLNTIGTTAPAGAAVQKFEKSIYSDPGLSLYFLDGTVDFIISRK